MSIFFRHLLKNTLVSCTLAVFVFVAVLILGNAVRDVFDWIASGRLSGKESVKILSIILPSVVSYALPLGVSAGILISVSRLSASNELLIMKSTGMSVYRALFPISLIAIGATVVSCFINLYYAPDSVTEYRRSFKKILKENPIRFIQPNSFVDWFPGYILRVDSINDGKLLNLKIWQLEQNQVICYISAKRGEVDYSNGAILLNLSDGNAEYFDKNDSTETGNPDSLFFRELSISLPITGIISEDSNQSKKLRHMNLDELLYARRHWHPKQGEILTPEVLKRHRTLIDVQISNNIATAFGVLAMSLVAVPLGIRRNRADTSINILLALMLAFSYYFAMVIVSWFGEYVHIHPEFLVWAPNCILAGLGVYILRKVARN